MRDLDSSLPSLSGSLLIAHPSLSDPNFRKSVLLISAHSQEDGAIGVILNRPTNKTLSEWKDGFSGGVLADVPVYIGGPVAESDLLLAAWRWDEADGTFRLYFGLAPEKLESLVLADPELETRAFVGYSGWSAGQVEDELQDNAWIVAPISRAAVESESNEAWRQAIHAIKPELSFLADAPDDPSLN